MSTTDRTKRPNLKKCKDCGAFGMANTSCKYWSYDHFTEWKCNHPKTNNKKQKEN